MFAKMVHGIATIPPIATDFLFYFSSKKNS